MLRTLFYIAASTVLLLSFSAPAAAQRAASTSSECVRQYKLPGVNYWNASIAFWEEQRNPAMQSWQSYPKVSAWIQRQQEAFPRWTQYLPSCPDSRFRAGLNPLFTQDGVIASYVGECYHPGAEVCFRSAQSYPSPGSVNPHGQQCCYDADGDLMQGTGAGTPDFVTPLGWDSATDNGHIYFDVYPALLVSSNMYYSFWTPNPGEMVFDDLDYLTRGPTFYVRSGDVIKTNTDGSLLVSTGETTISFGSGSSLPEIRGIRKRVQECSLGTLFLAIKNGWNYDQVKCLDEENDVTVASADGNLVIGVNANLNSLVLDADVAGGAIYVSYRLDASGAPPPSRD